MKNFTGHNSILHTLSVNTDGVLFSGGDNGTLKFWDWKTGYNFQTLETRVQPGSLENEAGIVLHYMFQQGGKRSFFLFFKYVFFL